LDNSSSVYIIPGTPNRPSPSNFGRKKKQNLAPLGFSDLLMALPHSPHCFNKALNRESQYSPEKKNPKVFQSFTYRTSF